MYNGDSYPASYPGYLLKLGDGEPEDGRDDLSSSPTDPNRIWFFPPRSFRHLPLQIANIYCSVFPHSKTRNIFLITKNYQ